MIYLDDLPYDLCIVILVSFILTYGLHFKTNEEESVIFIPETPKSELNNRVKQKIKDRIMNIRIVIKGETPIKQPTEGALCEIKYNEYESSICKRNRSPYLQKNTCHTYTPTHTHTHTHTHAHTNTH